MPQCPQVNSTEQATVALGILRSSQAAGQVQGEGPRAQLNSPHDRVAALQRDEWDPCILQYFPNLIDDGISWAPFKWSL